MKHLKKYLLIITSSILGISAQAQSHKIAKSSASEPQAAVMITIAIVLAGVILILGKAVLAAYENAKTRKTKNNLPGTLVVLFFFMGTATTFGQDIVATKPTFWQTLTGTLSPTAFYLLLSSIILEIIIIIFLTKIFINFSKLNKVEKLKPKKVAAKKYEWFEKLNNTKSVDAKSEADINLGHDYDGIGELDNPTPPWWQWGFVLSVIFAIVYMYTHHISKTAPNQIQELAIANLKAEELQKQYLANSANKIDENNVTLLTEASDIAEGKTIFVAACAACHRSDGGGLVGPNLTDDYWLHGGDVKDVFRTIKYGVPEKGMKSWKDDYPPKKIAQLAAYIHSLKGSNPPSPKEPEGTLYEELPE